MALHPGHCCELWLGTYSLAHPELEVFPNATLLLDGDNALQPDAILCKPIAGGRVWLDEEGYLRGAPELVCEIAATTASIDLHAKFQAYRRNGVGEYIWSGWCTRSGCSGMSWRMAGFS